LHCEPRGHKKIEIEKLNNMEKLKDIIIGKGIGTINFGMSKEELLEILGKPDETEQFDYDDSDENQAESWHYDELEISVSFEEINDWKLTSIAVSSSDYELEGKKLIGLNKDEVVNQIKSLKLGTMEYEDCSTDEDPDLSVITYEESALNLWFDKGLLSEIQWGELVEE
jgi:hypothetical protein